MAKLGLTIDDTRSQWREYTESNREAWKALGFRMLTGQVHDDDRALILAEMEVRKWQRLASVAEDKDTSIKTLSQISLRNVNKVMNPDDRKDIKAEAEKSTAKREILHFLAEGQHCLHKHTGIRSNYDAEAPSDKRIRLEARYIAYANLSSAYFKLAKVRLEHAEKTSVFGLRGEDL